MQEQTNPDRDELADLRDQIAALRRELAELREYIGEVPSMECGITTFEEWRNAQANTD